MPASQEASASGAVRPVRREDVSALKRVIEATGLFPADMLDGMMAGYLAGEAADDLWFTNADGQPVGIAYCAPERMTSGTWNLYLIAIHPDQHRAGHGAALVRHVESVLAQRSAHLLLVETSGLPAFDGTRAFYARQGFGQEARIRDFYQPGEDKVVFRKAISP